MWGHTTICNFTQAVIFIYLLWSSRKPFLQIVVQSADDPINLSTLEKIATFQLQKDCSHIP